MRLIAIWAAVVCMAGCPVTYSAPSWCGKEGCYQILGVKETADAKHIRNVYYKMSRQYHPDKTQDADAPAKFQRIAKAYEILNDARTRKRYDYALAHPEENIQQEEAYGIWKYWKTDARAVLIGFVLIVSIIQYYAKKSSYDAAWRKIRETPRYKNKRAQYIEDWEAHHPTSGGNGGASAAGKAVRRSSKAKSKTPQITPDDEAHIQDLVDSEVGLHGHSMPTYEDTLAYFILASPVRLARWLHWQALWQWNYVVLKEKYSDADKAYLTRKRLGYTLPVWNGLPDTQVEELLTMELWLPDNWKSFTIDDRPGSMKRRLPKLMTLSSEAQYSDPWSAVTGD